MKLTAENVIKTFNFCLFKEKENTNNVVKVDGIMHKFGFHPERLKASRNHIESMLVELPDAFHKDKGGGWSFLNACENNKGEQWGEHTHIEQLFCLGIGIGKAKFQMDRKMWKMFPGGMPYVVIL